MSGWFEIVWAPSAWGGIPAGAGLLLVGAALLARSRAPGAEPWTFERPASGVYAELRLPGTLGATLLALGAGLCTGSPGLLALALPVLLVGGLGAWLDARRLRARDAESHARFRAASPWWPRAALPFGERSLEAPRVGRFPLGGFLVGLGIAVVEGLVVVLPVLEGFHAAGLWRELGGAALVYGAVGSGAELALGPVRRRGRWLGAVAALSVWFALALLAEQRLVLALLVFGLVALWVAAALYRRTRLVAASVGAWALSPLLPWPEPGLTELAAVPASGPSIAIIVLDTARADRTSLERTDRDTTPNLAALASRGTRFERAYSPSCWSLPAHASMLTGLSPSEHGAHYEHLRLDPGPELVSERLRRRGYETVGVSANPLVAPGTGLGQGFVRFEGAWRGHTFRDALLAWRVVTWLSAGSRTKGGDQVVEHVRRWHAARDRARPFFLFVNLMEAHAPYQAVPEPEARRFAGAASARERERAGERSYMAQVFGTPLGRRDAALSLDLFDGALHAADQRLGELEEILGRDVITIVTADHGELVGEHEGVWGHNFGLYEALIRVPLVIAGPGIASGVEVGTPVSLQDLAPTVARLAGAGAWPAAVDLTDALRSRRPLPPRDLYAEHFRTDYFTGGWQLLRPLEDNRWIRARRRAILRGTRKRMMGDDGSDQGYELLRDPHEVAPAPGASTGLPLALPEPRGGAR